MDSKNRFVVALLPVVLLLQGLSAQKKPQSDYGKILIERPIKRLISKAASKNKGIFKWTSGAENSVPPYFHTGLYGNSILGKRIKRAVEAELALAANERVLPGKVVWHASHAAALVAAKKSGKPVLHFQLMGKLDEEFC